MKSSLHHIVCLHTLMLWINHSSFIKLAVEENNCNRKSYGILLMQTISICLPIDYHVCYLEEMVGYVRDTGTQSSKSCIFSYITLAHNILSLYTVCNHVINFFFWNLIRKFSAYLTLLLLVIFMIFSTCSEMEMKIFIPGFCGIFFNLICFPAQDSLLWGSHNFQEASHVH